MLGRVRLFLGLIRFSHTVFALPFALSSAALAWNERWRNERPTRSNLWTSFIRNTRLRLACPRWFAAGPMR